MNDIQIILVSLAAIMFGFSAAWVAMDEFVFILTHPEVIKGLFHFIVSEWIPALMLLICVCAFGYMLGRIAWRKK